MSDQRWWLRNVRKSPPKGCIKPTYSIGTGVLDLFLNHQLSSTASSGIGTLSRQLLPLRTPNPRCRNRWSGIFHPVLMRYGYTRFRWKRQGAGVIKETDCGSGFNWMIPNLYIENCCFTKHSFINGCLGSRHGIPLWFSYRSLNNSCDPTPRNVMRYAETIRRCKDFPGQ